MVSRIDKLIRKLLQFPNTMRFSEVKRILEHYGYKEVRVASSHHVFRKFGNPILPVPTVGGRDVKVDYLKQIAKALELKG